MYYISGKADTEIGKVHISNIKCSYCETKASHELTSKASYYHMMWIPVIPFGWKEFAKCTHCKYELDKKYFPPEIMDISKQNRKKLRRPIWHWTGLVVILSLIIYIIIT